MSSNWPFTQATHSNNSFQHFLQVLSQAEFWLSSKVCLSAWLLGFFIVAIIGKIPSLSMLATLMALLLAVFLRWRLVASLIAFVAAALWASYSFTQHRAALLPESLQSKSVTLVGQVVGLPRGDSLRTQFDFEISEALDADPSSLPPRAELQRFAYSSGKTIQLSCYRCPLHFEPSQIWRLTVRLKRPNGYASWGAFDFEKFLFRKQIIGRGYVRLKEENKLLALDSATVDQYRWRVKQRLLDSASRKATENVPHHLGIALILALMTGDKSLLSQQQREVFQNTGISHLIAISGLHIGLVFVAVAWGFKWLLMPVAGMFNIVPRPQLVLMPALIAAWAYSALAGFAVSTQRAFLMLLIFALCRVLAKDMGLMRVLQLAAAVVLLIDPFSILDAGFWLSCGAVFVIAVTLTANSARSLIRLQPILWLGMMPLTTMLFGQVSLISPIVNLVMVPLFCTLLIPAVLLCLIMMQLLSPAVADVLIGNLAWFFHIIYLLLNWLNELSFARYFPATTLTWQWAAGFVLCATYYLVRRIPVVFVIVVLAVLLIPSWWRANANLNEQDLRIAMLDVGQGLSMVVESKDYVLLYDAGPLFSSGFSASKAVVIPYLRSRGIRKINHFIVSHTDNDHLGDYQAILDAFEVDALLSSDISKVLNAKACVAGQHWQAGSYQYSILSPDEGTPNGRNNQSCVLKITDTNSREAKQHSRVIIAGDIERASERYLIQSDALTRADVLLVPHHGSKSSSTVAFVQAVSPIFALVSAGYVNRFKHPNSDIVGRYQAQGSEIVSTIENGSTILDFDGNEWSTLKYRVQNAAFWRR